VVTVPSSLAIAAVAGCQVATLALVATTNLEDTSLLEATCDPAAQLTQAGKPVATLGPGAYKITLGQEGSGVTFVLRGRSLTPPLSVRSGSDAVVTLVAGSYRYACTGRTHGSPGTLAVR
jgi:hypothetical protein